MTKNMTGVFYVHMGGTGIIIYESFRLYEYLNKQLVED